MPNLLDALSLNPASVSPKDVPNPLNLAYTEPKDNSNPTNLVVGWLLAPGIHGEISSLYGAVIRKQCKNQSLTIQVAELTTRLEKMNELPSTMVLDLEHHVSELVLESKEDDDSYSLFPTKLVESEEEEAEISISSLLESSTTDFGFINDMVPINTDTPSLEWLREDGNRDAF
ncbi:hypothetical protein COLO4_27425 [Corchorus olitorius]|uniref:Uncharacterized protein n=1 Tax=Corchorus olitorius TaxID=93759 RepID=A0A1R3HR36_9ROSI|nr:hypothetical protein COLO4_27425 [Corchorus olitorius]